MCIQGYVRRDEDGIIIIHFYFCFFEPAYSIPVHLCNVRIATSSIFSSGRKDVFFYFIILQNVKFCVKKKSLSFLHRTLTVHIRSLVLSINEFLKLK